MGEIWVFDKAQADKLSTYGFKYIERNADSRKAYVFIQTAELMAKMSNFDKHTFAVRKTVCL